MKTKTIQIGLESKEISMFSRGSDVLAMKIWRLINSKSKYECWYVNDLEKKLKVSPQKIRKALGDLEARGYIKKIKVYPVFWKKMQGRY